MGCFEEWKKKSNKGMKEDKKEQRTDWIEEQLNSPLQLINIRQDLNSYRVISTSMLLNK